MRKILVIGLVSIHLFGNTELVQVLRLPNLVQHYFEHCRIKPDLGFIEFMCMHYGGDDGTDADNTHDQQLPCRDAHNTTLAISFSPMTTSQPELLLQPRSSRVYNSRIEAIYSFDFSAVSLQPPRQAC